MRTKSEILIVVPRESFSFPKKLPEKWRKILEKKEGKSVKKFKVIGKDKRGLIVQTGKDAFKVLHNGKNADTFGYATKGFNIGNSTNRITGSWFSCPSAGTANSITVYLDEDGSLPLIKCAIYKKSDNSLVGYTEQWEITSNYNDWKTFNIVSGGSLTAVDYYLVVWSNDIVKTFFDTVAGKGAYDSQAYGAFPNPWSITETTGEKYSIYCTYTPTVVVPTVTTQAVSNKAPTTGTGNGNITATGGANATRRGFCYMAGTSGDPTTANSVVYDDGDFGVAAYTKAITGLTAGTAYRVRAYAVNSAGTGYGATVAYTTMFEKILTQFLNVISTPTKLTSKTFSQIIQSVSSLANATTYSKTLSQALIIVPVLSKISTLYKTLTETIKTISSAVFQTSTILIENLIASPILGNVLSAVKTLTEVIVVNSNALFSASRTLVEALVIAPVYSTVLTAQKVLTEVIQIVGTIARETGRILAEVFNVSDLAINIASIFIKVFTEIVSIVEITIGNVLSAVKVLTEQVKIALSFLVSGVFYKVLSEIIKAVDSLTKAIGRVFVEVANVVSSRSGEIAKIFAETIKITGLFLFQASKTLVEDVVKISELITTLSAFRTFEEVINITETAFEKVLTAVRTFTETIVAVPSLVYLTSKNLLESIIVSDTIEKTIYAVRVFLENIIVAGSRIFQTARVFSEAVLVIEQSIKTKWLKIFTEIIKVADNIIFNISRTFSEIVNIVGSIVSSTAKTFSESVIVQIISTPFAIGKLLIESVYGVVSWIFGKTQYIELVDVITATTDFLFSMSRTFVEVVQMASDVIIRYLGRTFEEIVYVAKKQGEYLNLLYGQVKSESFAVVDALGNWVIGKLLVEIVKVFDIINHAVSRTLSEVLSATDSVLSVGTKLLIESINVIGAMAERIMTRVLTEIIKMSDAILFRHTFYKSLVDVVKATGNVFNQAGKIFTENVQAVSEFVLGTISKMIIEAVKVVTDLTNIWTMGRLYSETIKLVDSILNQSGKIFIEIISVVSEFVLGTISKMLVEAVYIYDTIAKSLPKIFEETVVVVSVSFNEAGKIFTEVISVVGTFTLGTISKLFIEPVKVIASFLTGGIFYTTLTEIVVVAGNAFNQTGKIFIEVVSIVGDFILGTISKVLIEVVKVYDVLNFAMTRLFEEIINVVDTSFNQGGKILSEVLQVVGELGSFVIGKLFNEIVEVGETLTRTISRVFTEIVSVIGIIYQIGSSFILYETVKIINPTTIKSIGRTLTENITAGWDKIKLVLNGVQVGWWKKVARITGAWTKISRNDN